MRHTITPAEAAAIHKARRDNATPRTVPTLIEQIETAIARAKREHYPDSVIDALETALADEHLNQISENAQ